VLVEMQERGEKKEARGPKTTPLEGARKKTAYKRARLIVKDRGDRKTEENSANVREVRYIRLLATWLMSKKRGWGSVMHGYRILENEGGVASSRKVLGWGSDRESLSPSNPPERSAGKTPRDSWEHGGRRRPGERVFLPRG